MNSLKVFNHKEFGELKIIQVSNQIWFDGNEVAKMLGYSNPRDVLAKRCKGVAKHDTLKNQGGYPLTIIPEPDLYRLIIGSKLPGAERFESWIMEEVLPSIRQHGGYLTPDKLEEVLTDPDTLIQLAKNLKEEQEKRRALETENMKLKPKALFAQAVETAETSILVGELAKLISQNGVEIGQNRLFRWLRENGYLIKRRGESYNNPSQYSMELGLMETKVRTISNPDGSIRTTRTTKITGKGQVYFINKFLESNELDKLA